MVYPTAPPQVRFFLKLGPTSQIKPPSGDQASKQEPVGSFQSQAITHTFKPRLPKEPQSPPYSLQQFTGGDATIFFSSPVFLHLLNLPLSQISMVCFKGKFQKPFQHGFIARKAPTP